MSRMLYRGYVIQVLWKADHRYVVHLFPHDQANAPANRGIWLGSYNQDIKLENAEGDYLYFRSVTQAIEAAKQHIDLLRHAALAGT